MKDETAGVGVAKTMCVGSGEREWSVWARTMLR